MVYVLTWASLLYYIATNYFHPLPHPLSYLAWPIYLAFQGCILIGIWVIAHECGHHAFNDYQWLDDTIGLILHSSLLVPYFSWKYSHHRHHSNIGSLEKDEVFVPKTKSKLGWYSKYLNNPLGRFITLAIQLTLGWPLYLMFNVSGRLYSRFACHYDPHGSIYSNRERLRIRISDADVLAITYGLYRFVCLWMSLVDCEWISSVDNIFVAYPPVSATLWFLHTNLNHSNKEQSHLHLGPTCITSFRMATFLGPLS